MTSVHAGISLGRMWIHVFPQPKNANCSSLNPNMAVCNNTCCDFGNGCVVDFSKIDIHPWTIGPSWMVSLLSLVVLLEAIPAVAGNLLVIVIIICNRWMRNDTNLFIVNMCVADLLTSLLSPITFLLETVYQAYPLGGTWCLYSQTLRLTLLLTSVFSLTVISVDRLWALLKPFHLRFRRRNILVIMLLIWMSAAAFAFYPSQVTNFGERQYRDFTDRFCEQDIAKMRRYWWLIAVCLVWTPVLVLLICFLLISRKLRKKQLLQEQYGNLRAHPAVTGSRQRALTMLFCMLFCFVVCWSPFLVYVIVYQSSPTPSNTHISGISVLYVVSRLAIFLSSAINPLLYALMHQNFRTAAAAVLHCQTKRTPGISLHFTSVITTRK